MKRVQLFEFEDFPWFPASLRTYMTRLLMVLHKMTRMADVLTDRIRDALTASGEQAVVDLGSGSGGAMPDVKKQLEQSGQFAHVTILLSDLYPNPKTVRAIESLQIEGLSYHPESVNAEDLEHAPKGLKTMVNSFHHMPSTRARSILESAYRARQPLLIYEMAENKMPLLLWWLLLPLSFSILVVMTLLMTPFVKPLTPGQLIFTYLIPVIPLTYAWDGQASLPRMYAYKDFDELLEGLQDAQYSWTVAPAKNKKGKTQGYTVFGCPG